MMTKQNTRKDFYVYTLSYPDGTVFYVGKGTGGRIDAHCKEAKRGIESYKCRVIRKIWSEGGQVLKQKVAFFDDERDAYDFEQLLITFFGRHTLANLTDGGEGASGGNRLAAKGKYRRMIISLSGPEYDALVDAISVNGPVTNADVEEAVYSAIRRAYVS